ncbi:protein mesh-like isoform X6 [Branchiostoma floridae x Branchiostoma belcheri]
MTGKALPVFLQGLIIILVAVPSFQQVTSSTTVFPTTVHPTTKKGDWQTTLNPKADRTTSHTTGNPTTEAWTWKTTRKPKADSTTSHTTRNPTTEAWTWKTTRNPTTEAWTWKTTRKPKADSTTSHTTRNPTTEAWIWKLRTTDGTTVPTTRVVTTDEVKWTWESHTTVRTTIPSTVIPSTIEERWTHTTDRTKSNTEEYTTMILTAPVLEMSPVLYPYGRLAGDTVAPRNDEGGEMISLSIALPYFDRLHNSLWVNTNGVISFLDELWQYTPDPFPLGDGRRLIAPFWADVNTWLGGHVTYRETTDSDILERATTDVTMAFPELHNFQATWVFIATWHRVSFYYSRGNKRNTFQAVLVSNGRYAFTIFNYGDITWTSGTDSGGDPETGLGGIPAQVGFNAGNNVDYFSVPASRTENIVDIEETSNVNLPGRWVFRIDSAVIQEGGCHEGGAISIFPFFGTMLGGTKVLISGPCFDDSSVNIWCKFGNKDPVSGWIESNITAACISPFLAVPGRIPLLFSTDGGNTVHDAVYTSVDPNRLVAELEVTENSDETITIDWHPFNIDDNVVNVRLHGFDENTGTWDIISQLATSIPNTGSYTISTVDGWIPISVVKTGAISIVAGNGMSRVLYGAIGTYLAVKATAPSLCQSWYNEDSQLPDFLEELSRDFPCPRRLNQALEDTGSFQPDPGCSSESPRSTNCLYHPGAHHCVLSIGQTSQGSGQQCCYSEGGQLLLDGQGRGTPDRVHPSLILRHLVADVYPWNVCCKLSSNCDLYFVLRPANDATGYVFPWPAWTFGDPHFITLDGISYTFNGAGEFLLLEVNNGQFRVQGRMEQLASNGSALSATILTALVMKENASETVQVQLSEVRTMDVLVDGHLQDFQELTVQEFNGFMVTVETASEARISFNSGIGVAVRAVEDMLSIAVTLPRFARGNTVGLLGKWNGDPADDLTTPDGAVVPADSSTQDIHYQFGLLWMISEEDSLFTYVPGRNYSSFSDSGFTPSFVSPSVDPEFQAAAEEVCGDNQACLFDVLITGRLSVANVSIRAVQEYTEQVEELFTCGSLDPPDVAGTLVISNYSVGSVATFECEYGVLATPWERVCQSDASWSYAPPPVCDVECPALMSPDNGVLNSTDNFYPDVVEVSCDDGYQATQATVTCQANGTWTGAPTCNDIDECVEVTDNCDAYAVCANTPGSFTCACNTGYQGDGITCSDINECVEGTHNCHSDAICINNQGSFSCACNTGYSGDGVVCTAIDCRLTFPGNDVNFAVYDNRCHWFSRGSEVFDYRTAEQFCTTRGGRLVTVKDSAKQQWIENYIINNLPRRNFWIGLKDRHIEKSFMWSDGTAFSNGDYSNWHRVDNPPKHHKLRDCVIIHRVRKEWAVVNCNKKRNRFICEMANP